MNEAARHRDLLELLARQSNGLIADDEREHLRRMLRESAASRHVYGQYMVLVAGLHWEFADRDAELLPTKPLTANPRSPVLGLLGGVWSWMQSSPRTLMMILGGALATYFVVLFALIPLARLAESMRHKEGTLASVPPTKQAPVGTLASGAKARWSDDLPEPRSSVVLPGEQYKLAGGRVELTLNGGTQIVIDGPASWQLESDRRLIFTVGKLTAYVPLTATGFVVQTPSAEVIDLGTEFGVEVDEKGSTDLHVLKGAVAVVRAGNAIANSKERTTQLTGGHAIRVCANGITTSSIPLDRGRFESARLWATSPPSPAFADAVALANPSFEQTPSGGFPGFPGYTGGIPGWTQGSADSNGLNDSSGPFADNGAIPDGAHVAFIQCYGAGPYSLSQALLPLTLGAEYTLSFHYNARASTAPPLMTVTLGDHTLMNSVTVTAVDATGIYAGRYHSASLTFTGDGGDTAGPRLTFANSQTSDSTLLLDDISLTINAKTPEPSTKEVIH